jgi:hypothetical protein
MRPDIQSETSETFVIFHITLSVTIISHLFYFIYMMVNVNLSKKIPVTGRKPKNLRVLNDLCSICLDNFDDEAQLPCSHSFCAKCITEYMKVKSQMVDLICPMCRCEAKRIFYNFKKTEENQESFEFITRFNNEINRQHFTSFCLAIDAFRLAKTSLEMFQKNCTLNNGALKRKAFTFGSFLIIFLIFYPLVATVNNNLEVLGDVATYVCLVCILCSYYRKYFTMDSGNYTEENTQESFERQENTAENSN